MFTIRRSGSFVAIPALGLSHCGHYSPHADFYRYEAWVKVDNNGLDKDGFVFDNEHFKKYFDGIHRLTDSCEIMCRNAARHFFQLAQRESPGTVREVCVRIWGIADSYAEFLWNRDHQEKDEDFT